MKSVNYFFCILQYSCSQTKRHTYLGLDRSCRRH